MTPNCIALKIAELDSLKELNLSTVGFSLNSTGSSFPSVSFDARIDGGQPIETDTTVSCIFWGQRSGFSISQIALLNNDGGLDYLVQERLKGREIEIRTGNTAQRWEDWVIEFKGAIDDIDYSDPNNPKLIIANSALQFEKPFQPNLYTSGNAAIIGKPKPASFGLPFNVAPVLIDPTLLQLDIGSNATAALVRDNGAVLTPVVQWTQSAGVITLNQAVQGKITADIQSTSDPTDIFKSLQYILDQAGASISIGAIDISSSPTLGFWQNQPITCAQVLNLLLDSFVGWWWVDNINQLNLGQLKTPSAIADLTITPNNFSLESSVPVARQDRMPGFSSVCAAQKNYFVHGTADIATSLTSPMYTQIAMDLQADYRIRKNGVTVAVIPIDQINETKEFDGVRVTATDSGIGTLLQVDSEAQTEATRWKVLRDVRRTFYEIVVLLDFGDIRSLGIGQTVKVTAPHNRLLVNKHLLVIGIKKTINKNICRLRLWG